MLHKTMIATAVGLTLALPLAAANAGPQIAQTTTKPAVDARVETGADARNLIGRNIQNTRNETIGEINSVHIGKDGQVNTVIVGVGGFLGIGEREVALNWAELQVSQNGDKVIVDMTKDQLAALPAYKYRNASYRGTVFSDAEMTPAPANRTAATTPPATPPVPAVSSDFDAKGNIAGSAIVGATVKNANGENVGTIDEVYVGKNGQIESAIVSVGGFLGIGARHVAMAWNDLKVSRDGNTLVVLTSATKDTLKSMPEYRYQRYSAKQG